MSSPEKTLFGSTRLRRVAVVATFVFCAMDFAGESGSSIAAEPNVRARASELVSQLGHAEFAVRERAAAGIIGLELDATAALRIGTKSDNREIRHRSAKLLALITAIDLERRFERFKRDTDPDSDYGLPAWDDYREVVGDSPAARSLFVSMHEDESRLLGQIGDNPNGLRVALENRCDQLRGQAMFERTQIRLGTTATLLFASTREEVEVSPLVQNVVSMACSGSSFEAAIESGPLRESLVTLAERWINRQPAQGITYALHLGLSNGLKGCLSRAREVFESPAATISDRIYACLCLARFGDETDFDRLETYLDDVNICSQAQVEGRVVVTQLRDIALAALVRVSMQEPTEFGFDRIELDRRMVFRLSSLGFGDEPSRVQAIASWREFRRSKAEPKAP